MAALMNEFLSGAPAQRLAWALVHFLWQGAAVAVAVAVAMQLLRKRSPQARWAVACVALALMAALPAVTACVVSVEAPTAETASPPAMPPQAVEVAARPSEPPAAVVLPAAPPETVENVPGAPSAAAGAAAAAPWSRRAEGLLRPILPWGLLVWLLGVAGMSLWHLGGWLLLQWTRQHGTRPVGPAIREMLDRLLARLAISRAVRLLESARVAAPVVVGWLRPVVWLPAAAVSGLTPDQLQAVLAHELAHIRRLDCLVRLFQAAVETLLFYHPAVWWVSARIRQESEHCCDEFAVALTGDRSGYAQALARVAQLGRQRVHLAAAATGGSVLSRIRRIVGLPDPGGSASARSAVAILVVVGTLAIAIGLQLWGCGNDAKKTTTQPARRPVTQQKDPGEQWVEGRVIDRLGRPVQGAMVSLLLADFHEVKTDSEGGFRYPLPSEYLEGGALKRRTYTFVSCPERNLAGVAEIDGPHNPVTVRLQPGITLRGRVLDAGGKTVPGARIGMVVHDPVPEKFSWAGGFQHEEPTFDADGRFEIIGLPAGCRYTLDTSAPGFGEASQEVDTRAARDGVLEIPPTVLRAANLAVSGIVIGPDDRPVGGARVYVAVTGSDAQHHADTVADSQGRFKIDGVCSGRLTLRAEPKDQSMHGVVMAEGGEDDVRVYLVSSRGACVLPSADKPVTLVGRPLPDLSDVGLDAYAGRGKPLLICFWNSAEVQSQQALCDLSARRAQLAAKGVTALGVLAFARNQQHLRYWLDKQAVDMPMGVVRHKSLTDYVGMVRCLERWGVRNLPWLILANEAGIVQAEGFQMDDLDQAVALVRPDRPRYESATQPAVQPGSPHATTAGSGQIVIVFSLKYARAADVAAAVGVRAKCMVTPDARANSLLVVAPADVIETVTKLVKELDVPVRRRPAPGGASTQPAAGDARRELGERTLAVEAEHLKELRELASKAMATPRELRQQELRVQEAKSRLVELTQGAESKTAVQARLELAEGTLAAEAEHLKELRELASKGMATPRELRQQELRVQEAKTRLVELTQGAESETAVQARLELAEGTLAVEAEHLKELRELVSKAMATPRELREQELKVLQAKVHLDELAKGVATQPPVRAASPPAPGGASTQPAGATLKGLVSPAGPNDVHRWAITPQGPLRLRLSHFQLDEVSGRFAWTGDLKTGPISDAVELSGKIGLQGGRVVWEYGLARRDAPVPALWSGKVDNPGSKEGKPETLINDDLTSLGEKYQVLWAVRYKKAGENVMTAGCLARVLGVQQEDREKPTVEDVRKWPVLAATQPATQPAERRTASSDIGAPSTVRVYLLKYANADEAGAVLRQVLADKPSIVVTVVASTNAVVVQSPESDRKEIEAILVGLDVRPSVQPPSSMPATQPAGSSLEFRIAPSPSALDKAELKSYMDWLKAARSGFWWKGGRVAGIAGRMPDHAWLAIAGELTNAPGLVTGEFKGQKYVLVSDKAGQTMLPGEGKNAWGLAKVYATTDGSGQPAVGFDLDDRGAELFAAFTKANINNVLAVVIDGKVVSALVLKTSLGKQGMIAGRFSEQEVKDLVKALEAGMPPAPHGATTQPAVRDASPPATQPADR